MVRRPTFIHYILSKILNKSMDKIMDKEETIVVFDMDFVYIFDLYNKKFEIREAHPYDAYEILREIRSRAEVYVYDPEYNELEHVGTKDPYKWVFHDYGYDYEWECLFDEQKNEEQSKKLAGEVIGILCSTAPRYP